MKKTITTLAVLSAMVAFGILSVNPAQAQTSSTGYSAAECRDLRADEKNSYNRMLADGYDISTALYISKAQVSQNCGLSSANEVYSATGVSALDLRIAKCVAGEYDDEEGNPVAGRDFGLATDLAQRLYDFGIYNTYQDAEIAVYSQEIATVFEVDWSKGGSKLQYLEKYCN